MHSQELLRLMTRNHNSFLRKNLTVTLTTDRFSATNVPLSRDSGFLAPQAVALSLKNEKEALVTRRSTKRRICKNKKRKGARVATFTKTVVELSKLGNKCSLQNRRANKLRAVAKRQLDRQ